MSTKYKRHLSKVIILITLLSIVQFNSPLTKTIVCSSNANANAFSIPKPILSFYDNTFNKGQRINIKASSTNYPGKVKYRLTLKNPDGGGIIDVTDGYSEAVKAGMNYRIELPISFVPGSYNVTLYVKRADSNVKYDNYSSKNFTISRDISIDMGNSQFDVFPYTNELKSNIFVTAANVFIKNVKLNGSIIVNPKETGNLYVQNTTASNLNLYPTKLKNVYIYNSSVKTLNVLKGNKSPIVVYLLGKTILSSVNIASVIEFRASDKSKIVKFTDKNSYSNLAKDKAGLVYTTLYKNQAGSPQATTSGGITTASAVTAIRDARAPSANISMPVISASKADVPLNLPLLQLKGDKAPIVEYAAVKLDRAKTAIDLNHYGNTYGIDLSTEPEETHIQRICITVSKDSVIDINGFVFKLKAHIEKQIKVLEDFGIIDNPPEGANMINSRTTFGDAIKLNGKLSSGNSKPQDINIIIKLN